MNEELEKQLAKVVEKSLSLAEKTGEFVIEQAPDLLREFYTWNLTKNIIISILMLFAMYIVFVIFRSLGKKEPFKEYGSEVPRIIGRYYSMDSRMLGGFFSFAGILICFVVFIISIMNIIKILVAPKIYLIEYFLN